MNSSDRYVATGAQAEYPPGSNDEVLANLLGITDPSEMAEAELVLLDKLYEAVVMKGMPDRSLTIADLVVTPIGRKVLGKTVKEDYRVVEEKFRRSRDGRIEGYGLVVLPR